MAKRRYVPPPSKHKKDDKPKYPSPFGSHQSMVDEELTAKLADDKMVVCKDERGPYATFEVRLDNGLADYMRTASSEFRDRELKNQFESDNESEESS